MQVITNRKEIEKRHHSYSSTKITLSALEVCIKSVEPKLLIQNSVELKGSLLSVKDVNGNKINFALDSFESINVVGAGKASARMAQGLDGVLKDKINAGAITIPKNQNNAIDFKNITVTKAAHPVPDNSGFVGTKKILEVLEKTTPKDLVFVLLSGGGSALLPMPAKSVSLKDKKEVTKLLLTSGANIHEINTVRKHISAVKGGQLIRHVAKGCTVISLILSDVVGDDLEVIASGPTVPDPSTFTDAFRVLKRYRLTDKPVLKSIVNRIQQGTEGKIAETPKPGDPIFKSVHNVLIGTNSLACKTMEEFFVKKNVKTANLGSEFDGSAQKMGRFLAKFIIDGQKAKSSFAIVAGGETTVKLGKKIGKGGRNQEAALSCAIELKKKYNSKELGDLTISCMGTDGIDGNSIAAGAIVTPYTIDLASKKKMNLQRYLSDHDSYNALKKLDSLIITGATGTNVNDVMVVCKV